MSGTSRSHLTGTAQRKARWAALLIALSLIVISVPIAINGGLRLELAQNLQIVPGKDVKQIGKAGDGQTLIVLPIEAPDSTGELAVRFRAAVIAKVTASGMEFIFPDTQHSGRASMIDSLDFWAGSTDGNHLLIRDTEGTRAGVSILIDLRSETIQQLDASESVLAAIPGDWDRGAWELSGGKCAGFSPNLKYISCFKRGALAWYLAGDWELSVLKYGNANLTTRVFRGRGFRPWVGWTSDDSRVFFQNEIGIWVAPINDEMLD